MPTFTFDPEGLSSAQVAALTQEGGVPVTSPFTKGAPAPVKVSPVAPATAAGLQVAKSAQELAPGLARYGPYRFSPGTTGDGGGQINNGGGPAFSGGSGGDFAQALASERPASSLQVRPPAGGFGTGNDLASIQELLARLQRGGGLGGARGEDLRGMLDRGGDTEGAPAAPSPTPALSPTLDAFFEGVRGKPLMNQKLARLVDLVLPFVTQVPLPLAQIINKAVEVTTNPLNQSFEPKPTFSSPPPGPSGDGDPDGAPAGGVPAAPSDAAVAAAGAIAAAITAENAFGPDPNLGLSVDASPGDGPGTGTSAPGIGDPGEGNPGQDPSDGGDSGDGGGSGDSGDGGSAGDSDGGFHRGGFVKRGAPKGPERRATLLEKEFVIRKKAVKLHRGLLEAINRGASKVELKKLVEAGR